MIPLGYQWYFCVLILNKYGIYFHEYGMIKVQKKLNLITKKGRDEEMKKKLAIIGTVALLGVGAVALSNQEWRTNTIFATAKDKQLAWLKEHEQEIVAWVQVKHPKIKSIQFDWNTMTVEPISNGVSTVGYNLSVEGKFNEDSKTVIFIDFNLTKSDDIPSMSKIRMNQPPSIEKGKGLYIYE